MDLNYLKKLVRLLEQSTLDEIEIEEEGTKIRVAKNTHSHGVFVPSAPSPVFSAPQPIQATESVASAKVDVAAESTPTSKLFEVKSPMVGVFYRSPAPDADPYINVGSSIQKGNVLCIIEAMKLMNEIESEVSGKIAKILVENSQPVEFGQPLFLIELS